MKERGLIFSGGLVPKILSGAKTQTRRVVTPHTSYMDGSPVNAEVWSELQFDRAWTDRGPSPAGNPGPYLKVPRPWIQKGKQIDETVHRIYPRYFPGDRIWVRETWNLIKEVGCPTETDHGTEWSTEWEYWDGPLPKEPPEGWLLVFRADQEEGFVDGPWRPSIHMPRWASRITLELTKVRVERLHEMNQQDAIAEGIEYLGDDHPIVRDNSEFPRWYNGRIYTHTDFEAMYDLWNRLNAKRGFSFDSNPWVWILEFKLLDKSS
jgi:hypothetical protein